MKTPIYICEEELLEKNLKILDRVQKEAGCKILVALKGFAMWSTFDLLEKYLSGATCSGLWEAKLASMKDWEVDTYSPAYKDDEIDEIAELSDKVIFNSFNQLERFKNRVLAKAEIGIRINPEVSSSPVELYDPCAPFSRMGVTIKNFRDDLLDGVSGLHFHTLCEQDTKALIKVLEGVEEKFGKYLHKMKWVNFGGGHHITRADYDVDELIEIIKKFKEKYDVEVILEPGEAVGWQTGYLVASVLDIVDNGMKIAILDTSAEAHMPDVLAMPYRPEVRGAGKPNEKKFTYRFGGNTCLSGDIIGDYSFDEELKIGDKIIFEDMIHYTMVKNTHFNGVRMPSIGYKRKNGKLCIVREFHFEDYKNRLS
jgi:carboxynorspermidine decarboxylase